MRKTIVAGLLLVSATGAMAQMPMPNPDQAKAMFDKIDQDKNGTISLKEWEAAGRRERGFQFIDANHDGKLTPEELQAAAARFRR